MPNPIYFRRWCEVSCSKPPPSEVKKREPSIIGTTRRASNFSGHRPTEGAIRVRAAPYEGTRFGTRYSALFYSDVLTFRPLGLLTVT